MKLKPESKVIIQGIAKSSGAYYAERMKTYGTNLVAGISSGQGGQTIGSIPVFDLVEQACHQFGSIEATIIFEEAFQVLDAGLEAINAGIANLIIVTGSVPPLDVVRLLRTAEATQTSIIGPGSSGIIVPGKVIWGTQESQFYCPGSVGLVAHAGALMYEIALTLTQAGIGQSICVNLGSDAIIGSSLQQWLQILATDPSTEAIVLVDRAGGKTQEDIATFITQSLDKPVIAYVAGQNTPVNQHLGEGDSKAIITTQLTNYLTRVPTAQHKVAAFKQANIPVAQRPSQIPKLVKQVLKK